MKASMFGIIAAMACCAAGAAMAGDGAETDFGMIRLPEPFGNVRMGMTQKEVEKALPKAKTHLLGEGSLRVGEVTVAPDRPWRDADFHFADGKLASVALWSGHPRGDVGGPDARRETAEFRSVAALFGAPDKEVWEEGGEGAFHESVYVWERHGATITLGQSFSWNTGPNACDAARLVVDCVHPVPARESPFATPLSDAERASATGRDTAAQKDALLPPEYGLSLGMGLSPECVARLGLRRDGESNGEGNPIVRFGARLPDRMGRGDILAALEDGKLVWVDVNWSYDDGWTADNPGMIRKVLDDTLLRLGPPTKRWTKETGKVQPDGTFAPPDPVEDTWHVWQWTKGDEDVVIEIRRSSNALRTLRASFYAGALRRLMPETLKFPESSEAKVEQGKSPLARFARVSHLQKRDALRQSRYATMQDCKKETACFYALWRHPIAEDAAGNSIRNASQESSDIPHPIPTLDAEHLEFRLPAEIGGPLAAIYGERATFVGCLTSSAELRLDTDICCQCESDVDEWAIRLCITLGSPVDKERLASEREAGCEIWRRFYGFGEWSELEIKEWTSILSHRPDLADKCDWGKLDGRDWVSLLHEQPQFADRCDWEKLDRIDWWNAYFILPEFVDKFDWEKLSGKAWCGLLASWPRFADKCDWDKLSGEDWCKLLASRPQFADKCDWAKLDDEDWSLLLAEQPQFAKFKPGN